MRFWQLTCFAAAFAASSLCVTVFAKIPADQSNLAAEIGFTEQPPSFFIPSATPATFAERFSVLLQEQDSVVDNVNKKGARLEQEDFLVSGSLRRCNITSAALFIFGLRSRC